MKNLYWCDKCYKEVVDENDNLKRIYFSCYSNQQWASHLKTKKHIKQCIKVDECAEKVLCEFCNKNFTKEGYEVHKKRNEKLWIAQKAGGFKSLKCNNFFTKSQRFETFEDYCRGTDPNKPIMRRTKVGKISPITNTVRMKNKNNRDYVAPKELVEIPQNDLIMCSVNNCNKVLVNDSNYTDYQLKEKFNLDMCNCQDEAVAVAPTPKNQTINPTKNNPIVCERVSDGLKLSIEEIDNTEKPQFIDHCMDCNKGIMDLDISKKIYDLWEMDYCDCEYSEDSDYD